jgi:hypothetical protein
MDISNINNILPSVITPSTTNKTVEQKSSQKSILDTHVTQDKINKQTINLTSQSFSNILLEIGLPNTLQNNQLANLLANYGQAINKQSMNQFSNALGELMNKGSLSMEAGIVLILNGLDLNKNNLEAVKQFLKDSGLSQNLLSLNKDLQKMINSINGKDLKSEISQAIKNKEIENKKIEENNNKDDEKIQKVNIKKTNNIEENKIHEARQIMKNPFDDLENEKEFLEEKSKQINKLGNEINRNIINILTIDILKNPSMFPIQISMLKKYFFELEKNTEELKDILKSIFGEIDEEDENIFTELLKLVVEDKNNKVKNNNILKNENFLKEIYKSINSLNLNLIARDILNKPNESMCLPLFVNINNKIVDVELMITREDKSNKKNEIGNIPIKIQLLMKTNNLGNVSVEINNLKKDLQINLSLENEKIKNIFKQNLYLLENKLKELSFQLREIQCNINRKQNDNNSILLPQKYKVMSMKRIEGVM